MGMFVIPIVGLIRLGLHKNNNSTVGDWVLYDIVDAKTGEHAKGGIGKAEDVMANGTNRCSHTSARLAKKIRDLEMLNR